MKSTYRILSVSLCLCLCGSLSSFAQDKTNSVISSAGDVSKSSTMILEWTVGEPVVETASTSAALLTQGFHQPLLKVEKNTAVKQLTAGKSGITIFPNPTTASMNVQLSTPVQTPLQVTVADGSGKVLLRNNFPVNSTLLKINLANLSQGTYFLQLTLPDGTVQGAYKVIKVQ